jgi:hypothetical protein
MMINGYEAAGGIIIGRKNGSTRRKTCSSELYLPQISQSLTWN